MKIHGAFIGACALAGLAFSTAAIGQVRDPAQPGSQPADRPAAGAQSQQPGERPDAARPQEQAAQQDKLIATWVALIDHKEVTLGQEAAQKATNPQVKEFAQRVVNDHKQSLEKLTRFGVDASATLAAAGERTQDRAAGFRPGETSSARPSGGALDFVMLKRDIAQRTLKATLDELRSKQGAEFDRCFMGLQIMGHLEAAQTLEALSEKASPELRQVLQQELQAVKHHLDEAKQIAQALERSSSARPGAAEPTRPQGQAPARPSTQPQPGAQPAVPR